ncbi:RNA polymerase subunit sigma-54 [Clostridium sp. W14A]|nr:RNA polymerase subunit sigma-54 [Clostridium sp. W14A]
MISVIIAAIEDDDDKAFMRNLYQDYSALVRSTVYKVMRCENDIDDLAEDIFVKLIEKIPLLRTFDCCKTAAYVVYTARSVAINFIKHRDVQQKHTFYGEKADVSDELMIPEGTLEEVYYHREELEALSDAVLRLPDREKDILYFKYILEKTDAEIAEDLSISPGSVREYLTRARRAAKKLMEQGEKRNDSPKL